MAPLMYFVGVVCVIVSAIMLKKTKPFSGDPAPFVMELPVIPYTKLKGYRHPRLGKALGLHKESRNYPLPCVRSNVVPLKLRC